MTQKSANLAQANWAGFSHTLVKPRYASPRYASPTSLLSHIFSRYVPCMHQKLAMTTRRCKPHCDPDHVCLDQENLLSRDVRAKFFSLLDEYDHVFHLKIKGYNGSVGPFEARVNLGPVEPPQRKGQLLQCARNQLLELQHKFDELEALGVVCCTEDINTVIGYLNPSFLIKKANGGYRLVTAT